jgi:DNA-binding Lrp family transcriptional regulator
MKSTRQNNSDWTFFSNNAHVLVCLTQDPQPTTREIAFQVGISERAVQRIVFRLVTAGVARIKKVGRRNRYELDLQQCLRHPLESHKTVGEFLRLITPEQKALE